MDYPPVSQPTRKQSTSHKHFHSCHEFPLFWRAESIKICQHCFLTQGSHRKKTTDFFGKIHKMLTTPVWVLWSLFLFRSAEINYWLIGWLQVWCDFYGKSVCILWFLRHKYAYVVIFATQVRVCCDSLSILWFSKWKSYVGGRAQNGSHSGSCITSRGTFQTAAGPLTQIYPLKKQEKNKNAISRKVRDRGERIVFWRPNTNMNTNNIRQKISTEYEYE